MRFAYACLSLYLATFTICAIHPYNRTVWFAENLPIVIIVAAVILISRKFRFSPMAYAMMTILPILHTIGGHFTFERVPFDWISQLFGFERNHYDRMAHFSVGFYAYPFAEYFWRKHCVRPYWLLLTVPICIIFTVAALYEVFEWQYAVLGDPEAGAAVLGSQGDQWDAQKDMLADGLGAITAMILFALVHWRKNPSAEQST